jgi:hypothetical protein
VATNLTGTYNFNPGLGGILAYALGRCGIQRPDIRDTHLADAAMAANLILQDWGNTQPNFWTVELSTITLIPNTPTYTLSAQTIMVLDAYITLNSGGAAQNRIMTSVGRSEYAAYPQPLQQGTPSVYWFDRVLPPTLTFYLNPDASTAYTVSYYWVRQLQDATTDNSFTVDIPYRFLMAFADALAAELAFTYAPPPPLTLAALQAKAAASKKRADEQDVERVPMYITPTMASYYRNR